MNKTAKALSVLLAACLALQGFGMSFSALADYSATPVALAYSDFNNSSYNSLLIGSGVDTSAPPAFADGAINLMPKTSGHQANVIYTKQKIALSANRSFSSFFSFSISNEGDGICFLISNFVNSYLDGQTNNLCMPNQPKSTIGIEFDTWQNSENGDTSKFHMGFDANSLTSIATKDLTGSMTLNDGAKRYAWVDYDGSTKTLTATVSNTTTRGDGQTMTVSKDLSQYLGSNEVYVGFGGDHYGSGQTDKFYSLYFNAAYQPFDAASLGNYSFAAPKVTVSADSSTVGASSTVTVQVNNADGTPAGNVPVSLDADHGLLSDRSLTTNASGTATTVLTNNAAAAGTATLKAVTAQGAIATASVSLNAVQTAGNVPVNIAFPNFNNAPNQMNMTGSGSVPAVNNGVLSLVSGDTSYRRGTAMMKSPLSLGADLSFSSCFQFKITPGTYPGDGMSFILTNSVLDNNTSYAGMIPRVNGLAVEFDTWQNSDVGDTSDSHIGVDVNGSLTSVASVSTYNQNIKLYDSATKYAWVSYDGSKKVLTVAVNNTDSRLTAVTLTCPIDLTTVLSSPSVYLGFAGDHYNGETYNISSWYFNAQTTNFDTLANTYTSYATSYTTSIGEGNTLTATVQHPVSGNTYQVWVYQKLPADVTGQATDQYIWVPMTAGVDNSYSLAGATADANGNYRVSMIETDSTGNVISRNFDSPASLPTNAVRIEKVLMGGKVTNGRETVNLDDSAQATQNIQIVADNATGYTLTYGTADNQTSVQAGSSKDTFPVSFANLGIGTYTFTATATNDAGQKDVRTFTVTTYSTAGSGHTTPVISGMTGGFTGSTLGLTLTGADTQGNALKDGDGFLYRFRAGEPGRGISYSAASVSGPTGSVPVPVGKYGTYQVYATAAYSTSIAYDDAAMGYYDYTRPGGAVTVSSYTVKENGGADSSATDQTGTTGKTYSFNATADVSKLIGGETARYSFWRCDASGWVLLKDWSPDATLSWTPAYAGKYIIQVRVQGSKAGSYESARSMTFDVASSTGLVTAKNVSLTLTVTGNKARQPVTLTTAATPSAGLLYRYEVQDPTLGLTLLNAYSPDNTFTWVPRKAGSYTVYVQVINQNSFGMYDAQTSQPATIG